MHLPAALQIRLDVLARSTSRSYETDSHIGGSGLHGKGGGDMGRVVGRQDAVVGRKFEPSYYRVHPRHRSSSALLCPHCASNVAWFEYD